MRTTGFVFALMGALTLSCTTQAEVYRWTDAEGKVHYSDKKPTRDAQNITREVSKQNLDTSSAETQKVSAILRRENQADRAHAERLAQQEAQRRLPLCKAAQKRMSVIKGHVIFVDDQGKVVQTNEAERQQKIAETQAVIDANCPE